MWTLTTATNSPMDTMDYVGTYNSLYEAFTRMFNSRYNGNRAPFGIFLHAGWFAT